MPENATPRVRAQQEWESVEAPVEDLKICSIVVPDAECDLCIDEIVMFLKKLTSIHDVAVYTLDNDTGARFKIFYRASYHLTTELLRRQLADYTISDSSLD